MTIDYIGEHLLPGKVGNAFIILSFTAALLSCVAYFFASNNESLENNWKKIARSGFLVHSFSVFGIIATLFYMIINNYFEYQYVWQHSSKALPVRYMLSCFWEGQEGSFLLWSFWHVILGLILIRYSKSWEAPVMTVFSSVQVFLASMLLGIYIFEYRLGSNPFILLREHPDYANLPFVKVPNYLQSLDGRGLNPLLQNYWMTIHPPTLFLGFASTLVPFAFAIAALWKKKYSEWLKPALPWTFFGIMILGTGILMGGAWAYEALSFGGFWAWDPVENASLVPWLTLLGAGHTMLIYKNKQQSLFTAFFLAIVSFILILYSTFLTRSGVLGDSSVHAFTDLGMSGQLLVYLLFYVVLAIFLLAFNFKKLPKQTEEESIWSREFWMLIGALVLLISAFQIIFTTSIPVINKIFNSKLAPPLNPIEHYNSWQIPFAIIVALLIGFTQFLKYKSTDFKLFLKKISLAALVAVALTLLVAITMEMKNFFYVLLLFASSFAFLANLDCLIRVVKGNIRKSGSSIAHIGFGLLLLGALISTSNKKIISQNTSSVDIKQLGKDFNNNENIMLMQGDSLRMDEYLVVYHGKKKEGVNISFEVEYLKQNEGKFEHAFTLNPLVQMNPRMGNSPEPDTKHYLHKDIYTHVTYALLEEKEDHDNEERKTSMIGFGDTIFSGRSMIIFEGLNKDVDKQANKLKDSDIAIGARLRIVGLTKTYTAEPIFVIRDSIAFPLEASLEQLGLKFTFNRINVETEQAEITVIEKKDQQRDFVVMEAIIFPYINVLWLGCVLMIIGTVIALNERIKRI